MSSYRRGMLTQKGDNAVGYNVRILECDNLQCPYEGENRTVDATFRLLPFVRQVLTILNTHTHMRARAHIRVRTYTHLYKYIIENEEWYLHTCLCRNIYISDCARKG